MNMNMNMNMNMSRDRNMNMRLGKLTSFKSILTKTISIAAVSLLMASSTTWAASSSKISILEAFNKSNGSIAITNNSSSVNDKFKNNDYFNNYFKSFMEGHDENNGGDHVRATFIKMGETVLKFLTSTDEGMKIVTDFNLDYTSLKSTLTIDVITAAQGPLIDNNGSIVDALGVPGRIVLDHDKFFEHFEKDRDVYYLVFHEMLRAIAVNDDDYVISKTINPFRSTMRIITHIATKYPLLGDQLLSTIVLANQIAISGTGCPKSTDSLFADFDFERNILDISFKKYLLGTSTAKSPNTTTPIILTSIYRKNCALSIPVQLPVNKRLVVSQIDMSEKLDLADVGVAVSMQFEAFLTGQSAPVLKKEFTSSAESLRGKLLLRRNDILNSNCGGSDLLRLNTSSIMKTTTGNANLAEVDRITLYFKVEDCSL
ncbi:MAG: DUF4360 domain-containing protein [Oligoflexia bacterium]|nr:DUF4360 domain-containing protein [Oligoflexia bacterium]